MVKTINKDWSPNARRYSTEESYFISGLMYAINPYDEDSLNTLNISEQARDFIENIYGKNYYIDRLFSYILSGIVLSGAIPNKESLIFEANIKSDEELGYNDEFHGEISDWFRVYPINENDKSERIDLDYIISNAFKSNNFRRYFAGYLMTENLNNK